MCTRTAMDRSVELEQPMPKVNLLDPKVFDFQFYAQQNPNMYVAYELWFVLLACSRCCWRQFYTPGLLIMLKLRYLCIRPFCKQH